EVADFAARLERIPRDLGDWHSTDLELGEQEVRAARIEGYCYRRYENARNRHAVTVLLVCGRAGPIAVHTPDICFTGAGYTAAASPTPFALTYGPADEEASFRTMRLTKDQSAFPTEIRVFWTWNAGETWKAPDQPRAAFAGRRALYKMYVLRMKTAE